MTSEQVTRLRARRDQMVADLDQTIKQRQVKEPDMMETFVRNITTPAIKMHQLRSLHSSIAERFVTIAAMDTLLRFKDKELNEKVTHQEIREAITTAYCELGDWVQLALKQREELPDVDHLPCGPSKDGIEKTKKVMEQLSQALRRLVDASGT